MVPGLAVATGRVQGPGELQPHADEPRPEGEDCLEAFHRPLRHPEAHLDAPEEEQPFDPLLFASRPGLLEECPGVLQAPGPEKEPAGLQVRESGG